MRRPWRRRRAGGPKGSLALLLAVLATLAGAAPALAWNPLWGPNPSPPVEVIGVAVQNRSTGRLEPGLSFEVVGTNLRYRTSAEGYEPTDWLRSDDGTGYPAQVTVRLIDLPPTVLPWGSPEQTVWLDNVNGNGKSILVTFSVFERVQAGKLAPGDCRLGLVTALYADVLGRWLDPAAQQDWPRAIAASATREQLIDGVLQSNEARFQAIMSFLPASADFRRRIDGDVRKDWLRQLAAGQPTDFIAADFANRLAYGGPVGASGDGDSRHTVGTFYRVLLGREPTGDELATWSAKLGNGATVYSLLRAIDTSDEFYGRRIDAASAMLLHRPPSAEEGAALLGSLRGGADWYGLWSTLARSPAYFPACGAPA